MTKRKKPDPHLGVRSANESRDVTMRVELDAPAKCVTAGGMGGGNSSQAELVDVPPDPGVVVDSPPASGKPAFRLPTMAEIERSRGSTGLRVASTFSGCGGSCLGLEMAGFDIRYASEFVEAAREVYALNHAPHVFMDPRDIREVQPGDILSQLGIAHGELDLFEGSPPCASFSTSGVREKGWGKVKSYSDVSQRTDDLFFEWARLLEGLMPRAFIAENVSGLVKGKAFGYFKLILERLSGIGYVVGAKVLDAQWLGVPQSRQRLILIGVRADLAAQLGLRSGADVPFPKPFPFYYSMSDALPHLRRFKSDGHGWFGGNDLDPTRLAAPTVTSEPNGAGYYRHVVERDEMTAPTPEELAEATGVVEGYAIERAFDRTAQGKNDVKYFNLNKPDPGRPLPTVTALGGAAGIASVVHPIERRKFTIRELKRLCAFPDDFQLTGSYAQQWERLGRSVPPRMMYQVGSTVRDRIFAPLGLLRDGWVEAP